MPGPVYDYSYDNLGRAAGMTQEDTSAALVNNVQYGPAGEMQQMQDVGTNRLNTFQYNSLLQLTRPTTRYSGVVNMDVQYTYSATQNNGQITQSQDNVTGEQVTYQYDSLQRLVSASTVGPQWGLTFTYDGFGNRRSQQVTKGTAPAVYASYDSATNRINGYIHDGNGNITWLPNGTTLAYDVENRVTTATVGAGVETYYYAPDGKRVYRKAADGTETMYFYGVKGERLPYQIGAYAGQLTGTPPAYFAGRRLGVATDRLGSVRVTSYFPYGEQQTTTAEDDVRFATYVRDGATGLDYAMNRYYSSIIGRFMSPDPYSGSINLEDPGSFNRYTYVENDPVNSNDPTGLYLAVYPLEDGGFGLPAGSFGLAAVYSSWNMGPEGELTSSSGAFIGSGGGRGRSGGGRVSVDPCDRSNPVNAKVLDFIDRNKAPAESVAASVGLSADFILAWAAFESAYGTGSSARLDNNNFFGLTTPSSGGTGGWVGAVPCSSKTGLTFDGFACFPTDEVNDLYGGNNLYYSALAALTSQSNRYLNAALAPQNTGGDISAIANAIAKVGFNSEPIDYGVKVKEAASAIARRAHCQ